jgi:phosphotriesterase-related protein
VPFVRTVLGDIASADLGVTDAHEHVIITGGRAVEMYPDLLLIDVDKAVEELEMARAKGLRSVVDAMPCGLGRDAERLAEVSRRSGVNIVAPTGLHQARWYSDLHWSHRLDAEQMASLFRADVTEGIDRNDYGCPIVDRSDIRAGVIKVGGTERFPTPRDAAVFEAAALTQVRTGVPILTHTEGGLFGVEQARFLDDHGADLAHVALSHTDKIVDREYHRELAASGARVEYDQAFRWGDAPNGTLQILEWLAEDGLLGHVTLGLDAARQGYWKAYGGSPGIVYFVDRLSRQMAEHGLSADVQRQLYVDNPAAAYTFGEPA